MKKIINKNVLTPYINALISQCKFLYGIDYSNTLIERLNGIQKVYVSDDLKDTTVMLFNTLEKSIYINSSFLTKDFFGNYILDYKKVSMYVKHSIIHELLHAASNRGKSNGIISSGNDIYNNSLNEGITQMLADDICGYYENKFLGSYNIEKIVANILRSSLGNDIVLRSYFLDPELLKNEVNKLSHSKNYYTYLNVVLTRFSSIKDNTKKFRLEDVLRSLVVNIVVPKYHSLGESKKEAYISKLLSNVSGDEVIKNKLIEYINSYLKLSSTELKQENERINNNLTGYENETNAMEDLSDVNRLIILDNGDIYSINGKTKITSREHKDKIYARLFELNGYKRFLNEKIINQYVMAAIREKAFSFNYDSVLKRRIMFSGIKQLLFERGYIVLNDYEEVDKSKSIVFKCIKKSVSFYDYKKVCENFSLCKNRVGKKEYTYSIVYNSTKNELEDEELKRMAFYALNWMNSVQSNGREGINEAFSKENKDKFISIFIKLCDINQKNNKFDSNIIKRFSRYRDIISRMLETPIQVEWVYDYISYLDGRGIIKEKKGLSERELLNQNYMMDRISEESREIVRKNK